MYADIKKVFVFMEESLNQFDSYLLTIEITHITLVSFSACFHKGPICWWFLNLYRYFQINISLA